jgi:hypothetical protein
MDPATLARAVAVARMAFGVVLIGRPELVTRSWIGPEASGAGAQAISRGLGARDLVLGAGAATSSGAEMQRWVLASIVADAGDLGATLAAGGGIPLKGRALVVAVAGAGIALGGAALAGLRR